MTDPNTPAPDAQQPTPPAPPAYGEYAPTPPPQAAPAYGESAPAAPAYTAPAYAAAPAYGAMPVAGSTGTPVPGKTMGIVAFILSFFVQLVALILGIVALVQSRKAGAKNGFALAAIIISGVLMVLGMILAAIFVPIIIDSINAATVCASDPSATVIVAGVQLPCAQILDQSGY